MNTETTSASTQPPETEVHPVLAVLMANLPPCPTLTEKEKERGLTAGQIMVATAVIHEKSGCPYPVVENDLGEVMDPCLKCEEIARTALLCAAIVGGRGAAS